MPPYPPHRRILVFTVYAFPVLVTVLAVVLVAVWLVEQLQDALGAAILRVCAGGTLILLIVDLLLLLGLLGFRSLQNQEDEIESR